MVGEQGRYAYCGTRSEEVGGGQLNVSLSRDAGRTRVTYVHHDLCGL